MTTLNFDDLIKSKLITEKSEIKKNLSLSFLHADEKNSRQLSKYP